MCLRNLILLACLPLALTGCAGEMSNESTADSTSAVERPVAMLAGLDGAEVDALAAERTRVFLFTRSDCPIANRYSPEIRRLRDEFAATAQFHMVYVDPEEPLETITLHREEYGLDMPALIDVRHELVSITGARKTPTAAVFTKEGLLIYSGRIDDRFPSFGKAREEPSVRDLELVLAAVARGETPEFRRTDAVGCFIADVAPSDS